MTVFDGNWDPTQQTNQIMDANTTGKYKAYVVFANDGAAVVEPVKAAISQGIPVVAAYVPIGNDITKSEPQMPGVVATVWHDEAQDGRDLADATIDAAEANHGSLDVVKVGYISGGNALPYEALKLESFKKEIASAANVDVVAEGDGGFLRDQARQAAENIIQAHPDINIIVSSRRPDGTRRGRCRQGCRARRKGHADWLGAAKEGVEAVDAGRWFATTIYLPYTEGYQATKIAIDAARGVMPEKNFIR